jgi:signal peptidase II
VKRPLLIIFTVLLLDQLIKIWIKTNMYLGQEFEITPWFLIHFTENNGMAFGMELGGDYGKLFLSVFRIVFVSAMAWYLHKLVKEKGSPMFITILSLVFAGAIGNIIDSVFYGVIFSSSEFGTIAQLFPPEGGYSSLLHGKVVDMFYFPLISGRFPAWLPVWGGESFLFFRPVFNLADASISIGVILWILFQKKIYPEEQEQKNQSPAEEITSGDQ